MLPCASKSSEHSQLVSSFKIFFAFFKSFLDDFFSNLGDVVRSARTSRVFANRNGRGGRFFAASAITSTGFSLTTRLLFAKRNGARGGPGGRGSTKRATLSLSSHDHPSQLFGIFQWLGGFQKSFSLGFTRST